MVTPPNPVLSNRIRVLDALRFIAAGAVLFQHIGEHYDLGYDICYVISPGVFGVVLFFLLSGFVIPMSVGKTFRIQTFIARRFWRIFPLVLFAFALVAIAGYVLHLRAFTTVQRVTAFDWIANLALVQDYVGAVSLLGVTWTLSLEIAWYAIFAGGMATVGRRFDRWLSILAPIGVLTLTILSLVIEHRAPIGRIGMIYAAVLGCRVYRYLQGEVSQRRMYADIAVFMLTMAASLWVAFGHFRHPNITLTQAEFPWMAACLLFVTVMMAPKIRESRLLNNRIVSYLGAISFSTYMLHPLAISVAETYAPGLSIIVSILLTLVFSVVAFHLIEAPGQSIGRRLTRPRGAPVAVGA